MSTSEPGHNQIWWEDIDLMTQHVLPSQTAIIIPLIIVFGESQEKEYQKPWKEIDLKN